MPQKKLLQKQGPSPQNEEQAPPEQTGEERRSEEIYHSGSVTTQGGRHKIHCLTVIGQVEGHYILPPQNKTTKYEHVIPQLVAIEEDQSIKGLLVILNTVGGDVEAGLAIAELLSGMKTPTVSLVLGGGHSIGVPLAVSTRYSFIAPTATMTVHPVRMNGVMLGVPQTLSYFDKMQERITGFVTANSRIRPEKFRELMMNNGELVMDIGTVLDGEGAVEVGLIDELGGLQDALHKLYDLIDEEEKKTKPRRGRPPKKQPEKKPAAKGRPDDPYHPAAGGAAAAAAPAPNRMAALPGGLGSGGFGCRRHPNGAGRLLHRPRRLSQGGLPPRHPLPAVSPGGT